MAMGMDVKQKIAKSLEKLLKKKNFDDITVINIVEESGISKATFYRYFKDKYAVVEYECEKSIMFFDSDIEVNPNLLHNMHKNLFEYIYLKKDFYSSVVKIYGQNSFVEIFTQSGVKIFFSVYNKKHDEIPEELKKITELYCYGFAMIVQNWILQGFKKSPEYMSQITYACIPESIKKYL